MATIHQIITREGIDQARQKATTKHERALVEAAYQVLTEDAEKIGFTYSGFALTSLPHKPHTDLVWRREGHNLTLLIESGRDRTGKAIGLPYGSYARFILLFLQSEAVRTGSREIELGRSMRVWLGSMGLSIGGTTYRMVTEQAKRISHCRLQFFMDRAGAEVMRHGGFVDGTISMSDLGDQQSLWNDRVLLNEEFYRALRDHPVPVSTSALRAIGPRSMVIDVYIWLAYRLHALTSDVAVSWPALHSQFGSGFQLMRKFRAHFIECLDLALAAYPDANVSVGERGITLHPSRPAISRA
ncbi:replication protein RepA [Geminicoccus flavidas]|uniref:replication protein RepA n=1 Tax=Geminicoccus flavidas TaxID=2506407 RepID=UPI001359B54F|nr:replication protein RepA [Geminicoccus flavidas]